MSRDYTVFDVQEWWTHQELSSTLQWFYRQQILSPNSFPSATVWGRTVTLSICIQNYKRALETKAELSGIETTCIRPKRSEGFCADCGSPRETFFLSLQIEWRVRKSRAPRRSPVRQNSDRVQTEDEWLLKKKLTIMQKMYQNRMISFI